MSADQSIQLPAWAEGYVYLLETSERWQKIGFSTDPRQRAEDFQGLPFCVWLSHYFPACGWPVETTILRSLGHKRVRGEWFLLGNEEIASFKTIQGVQSLDDLPERFRTIPAFEKPKKPQRPRVHNPSSRPWWRRSVGDWYVSIRGRQVRLRIFDREKLVEAEQAALALLQKECRNEG